LKIYQFIKKSLKWITPYGIITKYQKHKNSYNNFYKFVTDPNCRISGWIEPSHVKIDLDIYDHIQKQIFYRGGYEKESVKLLYDLLPDSGVFFDIGANIGIYSLNLFKKAKDVFAFEATKTTYDKLDETIKTNNIKNIHLYFNAVDDKDDKEVNMYLGDTKLGHSNNGSNSIYGGGGGGSSEYCKNNQFG
jgi:hypothetical protein